MTRTLASTSIPPPQELTISSKPNSPVTYTFINPSPTSSTPKTLVVFVNGLGLPADSWNPCIAHLLSRSSHPAILTYDRFGQGLTTTGDPIDGTPGKEKGHDFSDVVSDLHEILAVIAEDKLGITDFERGVNNGELELMMVGASIGVPITRLYSQIYPKILSGAIFLDSNMPHLSYSSFLPDPSSPTFKPEDVIADDCTLQQYIGAREALCKLFDLDVPNSEGLDRKPGAKLLPRGDGPKMVGKGGNGVELCVVGHDPVMFAEVSFERMGTPRSMSMRFTNKYWAEYNERLLKLTDPERSRGVVIAEGCGHFIQMDNPEFVAEGILKMMGKLGW
ncbi:Alpha/Beta hydrolase protein [Amylocarpus encephaloides]|uniref:Alpha/Beta hydrolase protein n=1 Tax=Amylocarpus encephaloides TaxID=45428 RepID=A0A9P7YHL7_9HELO|nr:Alpha/Beta hydrolase protein [Amylocarpus encephaloides]